jgi:hypothetical protein
VGFVVDIPALGQAFSEHLGFSYQAFHRLLPVIVDSVPLYPKKGEGRKEAQVRVGHIVYNTTNNNLYLVQNFTSFFFITNSTKYTVIVLLCHNQAYDL